MGCFKSSLNRIRNQATFDQREILDVKQVWKIIKATNIVKFGDETILRSMNYDVNLRRFWTSKISVDGNNFDFSQGDSCLRSDSSWAIGLREQSLQFIAAFERILSSIDDEQRLVSQIRNLQLLESISKFDQNAFKAIKQAMLEGISQRLRSLNCEQTFQYEKSWDKFLSFVVQRICTEKFVEHSPPTKIIISPATLIDRTSTNHGQS